MKWTPSSADLDFNTKFHIKRNKINRVWKLFHDSVHFPYVK